MTIQASVIHYFLNKDKNNFLNQLNQNNLFNFNYVENNFLTSIEFIQMIADFEEQFSITFLDEHLKSQHFSKIRGLIEIIEQLSQHEINKPCAE